MRTLVDECVAKIENDWSGVAGSGSSCESSEKCEVGQFDIISKLES
jgi:hypothetical protein